jgi:hypothetical protein
MKQSYLNHSKIEVFEAIKNAANSLELEVRHASLSEGIVSLYSPVGLFSFGNKIDVQISAANPSKCFLKVTSVSASPIQLIDWGKNSDIENSLINEVKNILEG